MANNSRALAGIYTLTPLHMGTGQAAGAVDLPVAREHHTGLPVIPATAVKGVWRDIFEQAERKKLVTADTIRDMFGPDLQNTEGTAQEGQAGGLIFTEGQCAAIPFRSASRPLLYCTSLLVLERLARNLRAFRLAGVLNIQEAIDKLEEGRVYVTGKEQNGKMLLVEDMLFKPEEVFFSQAAATIAGELARLVPKQEGGVRNRIMSNLVVLPDLEFSRLLDRGLPVQARIKLTSAKTASKYGDEKGNLWYEESVPVDSLFIFFLMNRPGKVAEGDMVNKFLRVARKEEDSSATIQLGGNETVGYGWCLQQIVGASSNLAISAGIGIGGQMTASSRGEEK